MDKAVAANGEVDAEKKGAERLKLKDEDTK